MLPKRLKLYQAYNIDFGGMADSYKANYLKGLNISGTGIYGSSGCSSGCSGSTFGNIFEGVLDMGMMVGVAALESKSAGKSVKASNNAAASKMASTIANYETESQQAVNSFNTKYKDFDVTISKDGVPTKSYDSIKAEITDDISSAKKNITEQGKKNLETYKNAKASYDNLTRIEANFNSYKGTLESLKTAGEGKQFTINADTATVKEPNAEEFKQFVSLTSEEQKTLSTSGTYPSDISERAKNTSQYTTAQNNNKKATDEYNGIATKKKEIETKHPNLSQEISDAKTKMEEAGNADANDSKISVKDYQENITTLEAKLASLGSKSDFEASVGKLTKLKADYEKALKGQELQKTADGEANALKNLKSEAKALKRGGHTGLRGMFYDMFHKDSKTYLKNENGNRVTDSNGKYITAKTKKSQVKDAKEASAIANDTLQKYYEENYRQT